MLEKIRKWIDRMAYNRSKQSCYDAMERRGIAVLGMCSGVVGGDSSTGYLAYSCCDCPYFVELDGDKRKELKEKKEMSIKLTTNCGDCVHKTVCQYKDNATNAMNELKNKPFDTTYTWEDAMNARNVNITFSCPMFMKSGITYR